MAGVLFYLAVAACVATAGILLYGITGFGRGKLTPRGQNRIMRLRIIAQFVAIVLVILAVWASRSG